MKNDPELLNEIFNDKEFKTIFDKMGGIKKQSPKEELNIKDSREKEVRDWMCVNGREPSEQSNDLIERIYAERFKIMQKNEIKSLEESTDDSNNSLEEIFKEKMEREANLTNFEGSILTVPAERKNIKKGRESANYSDRRTAMPDFSVFEPIFKRVQKDLDEGKRKINPFSAVGFSIGKFYICGGIICFIDNIYEDNINSFGRVDRRIHIIFANHTESYMLFTTFQKIMSSENGRSITEPRVDPLGNTLDELKQYDVETGYIYILRSLSTDDVIKPYGSDFYKIGYTSDTVEKRISNAINEATYLRAPVKIIEKMRCTNLNAKALETFIHKFLQTAQVRIMVNDKGRYQVASEWYNVPLGVLEVMVFKILDGSIKNYRYDATIKKLVRI